MAMTYRERVEPFSAERTEAIARILGDTDRGLRCSEIGHLLAQIGVADPDPTATKWRRLYNAFADFQTREQVGNLVVVFIHRAMDPAKYTTKAEIFHWRRDQLNTVLAFCGYSLGEDGKMRRAQAARTLSEAMERANRLQAQLRQRNVHSDVIAFCNAEILAENYFHASSRR